MLKSRPGWSRPPTSFLHSRREEELHARIKRGHGAEKEMTRSNFRLVIASFPVQGPAELTWPEALTPRVGAAGIVIATKRLRRVHRVA
jgi:hypothetical protein